MSTPSNSPSEEPRVFNVFVYGSLLPGLHNFGMATPALVAPARPAVVHGYTLHSNYSDSYPYLAEGVAEGTSGDVKGAVLLMEYGYHMRQIIGMEEGAGYDTSAIEADVTHPDGTIHTDTVIAFIHRQDRAQVRGNIVRDGDWMRFMVEQEERRNRHHMFTEHLPTRRM